MPPNIPMDCSTSKERKILTREENRVEIKKLIENFRQTVNNDETIIRAMYEASEIVLDNFFGPEDHGRSGSINREVD